MQKQKFYVDQYDGPSSLILLSTPKYKNNAKNGLNTDRAQVEKNFFTNSTNFKQIGQFEGVPDASKEDGVKSPKERYKEFNEIRCKMQEYSGFKTQQRFFKQRERLLMGNWRHGILGT
jgi:hypothetical protein